MRLTPHAAIELTMVGLAAAAGSAPSAPAATERWFSSGLYPRIQQLVTPVSNLAPFALFDVVCVAALATFAIVLARGVGAAWRTRRLGGALARAGHLAAAAAVVYLLFLVL